MRGTLGQLIRYGIVGILTNAVGYLIYLGITRAGLGHKEAMTLLYAVGIAQTFVISRRWTFRSKGSFRITLTRYVAVYALGYAINYSVLYLFVDRARIPHQWVMGGLLILMTMYFFLAQKFWVFRPSPRSANMDKYE